MNNTIRKIIFWGILAGTIAMVVFGIIRGDIFETRMEASTL